MLRWLIKVLWISKMPEPHIGSQIITLIISAIVAHSPREPARGLSIYVYLHISPLRQDL